MDDYFPGEHGCWRHAGSFRGLMAGSGECHAQACRQRVEVLVYRPKQRVRGEQNGGEQRHIYRAEPWSCNCSFSIRASISSVVATTACRSSLRSPSVRSRGVGGVPHASSQHDEWMAQHLIHRKQRLKHGTGTAEMRNPDRGIRKNKLTGAELP